MAGPLLSAITILFTSAPPTCAQVTVRTQVINALQSRHFDAALVTVSRSGMTNDAQLQSDPELFVAVCLILVQTNHRDAFTRLVAIQTGNVIPGVLFKLGTRLAEARQYADALQILHRIPDALCDEAVYFNRALAQSHLGGFAAARADYFRAINASPWHIDSYFHVGLDYAAEGKPNLALPWLARANRLAPARPEIAAAYVSQLLGGGYTQTARDIAASRLHAASGSAADLCLQGDVAATSEPKVAGAFYRRALQLDAQFLPALLGLGRLASKQGDNKAAGTWFKAAQLADPESPAREELGMLAYRTGDSTAAIALLKPACQYACSPEAHLLLAKLLDARQSFSESYTVLSSVDAGQQSIAWHLEMSRVAQQLGHKDIAERELQIVQRLQNKVEEALPFHAPGVYIQ